MWAVLFICLCSRTVYIEMVLSTEIPAFIESLRPFLAIKRPFKVSRSDTGTNFVRAFTQNLDICHKKTTAQFTNKNIQFIFNRPHSSHFDGAWERKIGHIRRGLDCVMVNLGKDISTAMNFQHCHGKQPQS